MGEMGLQIHLRSTTAVILTNRGNLFFLLTQIKRVQQNWVAHKSLYLELSSKLTLVPEVAELLIIVPSKIEHYSQSLVFCLF